MRLLYIHLLLIALFFTDSAAAKENVSWKNSIVQDSLADALTTKEWKKFKYFEAQLQSSELSKTEKEYQLRGYARDSLQILKVKLVAIKVLQEQNLLNRDIQENTEYYNTLLVKLQQSDIPSLEYRFLEEKLAYLSQQTIDQELVRSRWLNIGLISVVVILAYWVLKLSRKKRKHSIPELSKQETMVRNLILQGKSNKEIASELFISLSTVKSHITNIYGKLNVSNRQELLRISTGAST
ncbi:MULTISPECIES: response regulator transcription factor [Flavobacteriaceae]|uniref:response regulator transcription factor n=1 Tax=Flavobacteriaceae TaxID=49546 RepID=UPI001FEB8FF9|nr:MULTISPECIES: LuxR C-terminal-related transcriptional regulator [Allomuricauda]MDC6365810.1 LuxR C-terminal-related transcriptional regulator [Muricauda sp. AC10]